MNVNELLENIQKDIAELKGNLPRHFSQPAVSEKWVSRTQVMTFLNYGSTQMAEFEKSGDIVVSKIGKRKFILKESLEHLLDKNIINSS